MHGWLGNWSFLLQEGGRHLICRDLCSEWVSRECIAAIMYVDRKGRSGEARSQQGSFSKKSCGSPGGHVGGFVWRRFPSTVQGPNLRLITSVVAYPARPSTLAIGQTNPDPLMRFSSAHLWFDRKTLFPRESGIFFIAGEQMPDVQALTFETCGRLKVGCISFRLTEADQWSLNAGTWTD